MKSMKSEVNARDKLLSDGRPNLYWEEYLDANGKTLLAGFDSCTKAVLDMFQNLEFYGIKTDPELVNSLAPDQPGFIDINKYNPIEFSKLPSDTAISLIFKYVLCDYLEYARNDMVTSLFDQLSPGKRKKLRKQKNSADTEQDKSKLQ